MDEKTKFNSVLEKCESNVHTLDFECISGINNIEVANNIREFKRQNQQEKQIRARNDFIEEEKENLNALFVAIESKWKSLYDFNDSLEIHKLLTEQKESYMNFLIQKENIINELKNNLMGLCENYTLNMDMQKQDIEILIKRMNEHTEIMKIGYRSQLSLLENTVKDEQQRILNEKFTCWMTLNNDIENNKVGQIKSLMEVVKNYEDKKMVSISNHYEQYRILRKNLITNLQDIQLKLKEATAIFKLQEQILEYNHLVTSKRQREIVIIKAKQRQKLNTLKIELIKLYDGTTEIIKKCDKKKKIIKAQKNNILINIDTLLKKNTRMHNLNEMKLFSIWSLNEKRFFSLLDMVTKIDRELNKLFNLSLYPNGNTIIINLRKDTLSISEKNYTKLQFWNIADIDFYWEKIYKKVLINIHEFWKTIREPLQHYCNLIEEERCLFKEINTIKNENEQLQKFITFIK